MKGNSYCENVSLGVNNEFYGFRATLWQNVRSSGI